MEPLAEATTEEEQPGWFKQWLRAAGNRIRGVRLAPPRPIVLARVEDHRSMFPEGDRITAKQIDEAVDNFNADDGRRVPVTLAAPGSRSAHANESKTTPPVAFATEVWRDGPIFFARLASVVDSSGTPLLDAAVAVGYTAHSVEFRTIDPGRGVQLVHIAIASGEQPGIRGLPHLDECGFGVANLRASGFEGDPAAIISRCLPPAAPPLSIVRTAADYAEETPMADETTATPLPAVAPDPLDAWLADPAKLARIRTALGVPEPAPAAPAPDPLLAAIGKLTETVEAMRTAPPALPPVEQTQEAEELVQRSAMVGLEARTMRAHIKELGLTAATAIFRTVAASKGIEVPSTQAGQNLQRTRYGGLKVVA
jgi:hypothetical protein